MTERKCLVFSFADVQVREREFCILRNGEALSVEPKAFRVLLVLLRNPQKLVTKEELLDAVWADTAVSENSLTRSIALLRRLLGDDTREPHYIATVPTVGYRFLCDVRVAEDGSAELNAQGSSPTIESSADDQPTPAAGGEGKGAVRGIFAGVGAVLLLAAFLIYRAIGGGGVFGHAAHPAGKTASNARVVPLTTVAGNVWDPAFSPDGKQIAFMWDGENPARGDLYVQMVGGVRPLRLTHTPSGFICCADWSPDGLEIAFGRCTDDGGGVYVVPALGGVERKLTDAACFFWGAGQAKWTADGKSLVLVDRCAPDAPPGIMVFSMETGQKRCVTAPPPDTDPGDGGPVLSPDGKTIAFVRVVTLGYEDIYAVELPGKNLRQLKHDDQPTGVSRLMWTPDGRYIVFGSDRNGAERTWRVSAEGGAIEPDTVYPEGGVLTSDGQRLAYVEDSSLPAETWKAELASPGGKVLSFTKVVFSSGGNDSTQLSPDGRQIVFRSARTGREDIWKSDVDGSDPQRLTSFDKGWPGTPRWSPDGKRIVFDSRLGEHSRITVVDSEGRNQQDIVAGDYENVVPSWSRDGRFIYFASIRTGKWQVWKRELETGTETQVTRNGGFAAFESYDGKSLYYSRWEGGGLWRMPIGGDAEEHVTSALHRGYWGHFAVTEAGIYLLDVDATPGPTIMYYSFQTRQLTPVLQLQEHPIPFAASLSASRDGRTLLITQGIMRSSIMMAENFQ